MFSFTAVINSLKSESSPLVLSTRFLNLSSSSINSLFSFSNLLISSSNVEPSFSLLSFSVANSLSRLEKISFCSLRRIIFPSTWTIRCFVLEISSDFCCSSILTLSLSDSTADILERTTCSFSLNFSKSNSAGLSSFVIFRKSRTETHKSKSLISSWYSL